MNQTKNMENLTLANKRGKSRSCHIPNTISFDQQEKEPVCAPIAELHEMRQDQAESSESSQWKFKKLKPLIITLFMVFLVFYIYIVSDRTPPLEAFSQKVAPHPKEKCYKDFRLLNCTLDRPSSQTCVELYNCINQNDVGDRISTKEVSTAKTPAKIDEIEEFLENILILFGGMGFGSLVGMISPRFTSLLRTLKNLGQSLIDCRQKWGK